MSTESNVQAMTGAEAVVRTLERRGIEDIFGVSGAKIDTVFNALADSKVKTVVCRGVSPAQGGRGDGEGAPQMK
jgi:acetolactate synthase I/II/III large subunit